MTLLTMTHTYMFESLVQSLLEKYIGRFVEDFAEQGACTNPCPPRPGLCVVHLFVNEHIQHGSSSSTDLKIGLFKGKAYLRNLVLRKDALDFLDLPIVIRAGFVVQRT